MDEHTLLPKSESRVRIVGDHPHRGASGTVRDDRPMLMGMWEVDLDPGNHGVSGCFAGPKHLRPLGRNEDPYA